MRKYRKFRLYLLLCVFSLLFCGCISVVKKQKKLNDLEFKVLDKEKVPKKLKKDIEKSKGGKFYLTYVDQGKLYIARGYGAQKKSGYSVSVMALYETKDYICIRTKLIGPKRGENTKEAPTYPYVVVALDEIEKKDVVFE